LDKKNTMPVIGVIKARECPLCGHHEVGVVTVNGDFYPLRPGTCIQVLDSSIEPEPKQTPQTSDTFINNPACFNVPPDLTRPSVDNEKFSALKPWLPSLFMSVKRMRLKYGVLIDQTIDDGQVDAELYASAYLKKLEYLLEKETFTGITVLLDKFFSAPQLASENPKTVVMNMWQELDEVREPVEKMCAWLNNPADNDILNGMMEHDVDNCQGLPSLDTVKEELQQLRLADFLGLF